MEDFRTIGQKMLNEVTESLSRTDPRRFAEFVGALSQRRRVLVAGEGYSLGVVRGFAHALSRVGVDARVVGESTTPGVKLGDLLVVVSESGGGGVMAQRASSARGQGATVAVVTADARASVLSNAQIGIVLPGPTRTPFTPQAAAGTDGLVFAEAAMVYLNAAVRGLAGQLPRRDYRDAGPGLD